MDRKAGGGVTLWRNVPERERAAYKRDLGIPGVVAWEWAREYPEPSCRQAVMIRRNSYKPCPGKAAPDGFCTRHSPEILRAAPIPNIVGEAWG